MLIMSLSLFKRLRKKIVAISNEGGDAFHQKNNTWKLTTLLQNHKKIGVK